MPISAYLSLGSNIGNRESHLCHAIARLQALGHVAAVSSLYETEPVEFTDQPWFLNCVVLLETNATPAQLLANLLAIEQEMGRVRTQKKGPRTIDIDILLFGETILDSPAFDHSPSCHCISAASSWNLWPKSRLRFGIRV